MDSQKTKSIAKLSVFTIAIMNVTAVVSLRGLPAEAEYGLSSAFYYLFAAIVFLISKSFSFANILKVLVEVFSIPILLLYVIPWIGNGKTIDVFNSKPLPASLSKFEVLLVFWTCFKLLTIFLNLSLFKN